MCNNNGHCRKFDAGTMCPSYRATGNERDLTRGRANTLRLALSGQIEGEDYALAADAAASGVSLAVTLTAGLATPAASETPVTVHTEARFSFEDCIVHRRLRRDLARPLQADHMAVIMAPAKGAPTTPVMNDSLELEDGTVGRVANQVISGGAFWRLQMG